MEDIEAELEAKSIERDVEIEITEAEPQGVALQGEPEPEPVVEAPPKKTKKIRSEKQSAAFEKARLKRAEAIAARKKLKEEQKEESLPEAFRLTQKDESDVIEAEKKEAITEPVKQEPIPEPVKRSDKPQQKQKPVEPTQLDIFDKEASASESKKPDTDEVSLDDLVSDWQ